MTGLSLFTAPSFHLTLTQVLGFQHLVTRFNDVQLYVLNHTVSELKAYGAEFVEVFSSVVDRASGGAYFLFIDTNYPDVVGLIDQAIGASHLSVVDSQVEQTNLDEDEIKEHLGRWYRLMERDPKLQWNAVFKLARKPDEIPF